MLAPTPLPASALIASLREIAHALSAAWDVDSTLDLIARKTAQVMSMDSCSIYLLEGDTLWLRASTGLAPGALGLTSLRLGEGLTGWAAQYGEPVAAREARQDPRFKFLPQTDEQNFQSLLAVPLVNRGRVIGALNVQTRALHGFTPDEIELAALISDLAAGALDRALLYDSMNRQIHELTTLADVSRTVTSPIYLDEMLDLVVEMAAKVMGAPVCSIELIDQARGEVVMRSAKSESAAYHQRPALKLGEGISGIVIRERRPVAVPDVRLDTRYRLGELAQREGLVSLLAVPLTVRDEVIGVFNCYTTEQRAFTEPEITLFSTLANQTALAIQNAQLVTNAAIVREMHHRIKNNLQTVAMLLEMQASRGPELSAQDVLQVGVSRIYSIAAVHEALAQEGFRLVNVKDVTERIVSLVAQNMVHPDLQVNLTVAGEPIVLASRPATSLALVINELLQNALEHAFVGRASGAIRITLGHSPTEYVIEVADDGAGFSTDTASGLGLEIVETLVRDDLRGRLEIKSAPGGTQMIVRVPRDEQTDDRFA
jgi:two-component sensor histidine kinase